MNKLVYLGQQVKAFAPQYRDKGDEAVGLALVQRVMEFYPGHDLNRVIDAVFEKVSADRGIIASWIVKKGSEFRTKANLQFREEAESARRVEAEGYALQRQREEQRIAHTVLQEQHKLGVEKLRRDNALEKKAAKKGVRLVVQEQIVTYQEQAKADTKKLKKSAQIETEKEKKITQIKFNDHKKRVALDLKHKPELNRIENERQREEFENKVRAAITAKYFEERQQLHLLNQELLGLIDQLARVDDPDSKYHPNARKNIKKRLQRQIDNLEAEINVREARLIQSHSGSDGGRISEAPRSQPNVRRLLEEAEGEG